MTPHIKENMSRERNWYREKDAQKRPTHTVSKRSTKNGAGTEKKIPKKHFARREKDINKNDTDTEKKLSKKRSTHSENDAQETAQTKK